MSRRKTLCGRGRRLGVDALPVAAQSDTGAAAAYPGRTGEAARGGTSAPGGDAVSELLTIAQGAERLNVHENTVRRLLPLLGAVNIARPGAGRRTIRIPAAALERYLAGGSIYPVARSSAARPANESWRIPRRRPGT